MAEERWIAAQVAAAPIGIQAPATDAEHGPIKQTVKAADAYGTDHIAMTKLTDRPEADLLQEAAHGHKWTQIVCGRILIMHVKRTESGVRIGLDASVGRSEALGNARATAIIAGALAQVLAQEEAAVDPAEVTGTPVTAP